MNDQEYTYEEDWEEEEISRRTIWIAIAVAAAVLLACACVLCLGVAAFIYIDQGNLATPVPEAAPTSAPAVPVEQIQNVNWQWVEWIETDSAFQSAVPNPENYLLVFRPDGQLHLRADCNVGLGAYAVLGNQIALELGALTLSACPQGSLSNQYLALLSNVGSFGLDGDRLVLYLQDPSGRMVFAGGGPAISEPTPTPPAQPPTTGQAPQPVISAPPEALAGQEVAFDGNQSQPGSSPIASYAWDFGDGTTAQGAVVSHVYGQPGTYQVNLTVTGEDGVSGTTSTQIVIVDTGAEAPPAAPPSEPSNGLVGLVWKWAELSGGEAPVPVPDPAAYTLTFNPDGTFNFQADCNSGSGSYLVDVDRLALNFAPSEVDCGPNSLSSQYQTLLLAVESFEPEGDRLLLYSSEDEGRMAFVP
jgi:heat shock protein HslJ